MSLIAALQRNPKMMELIEGLIEGTIKASGGRANEAKTAAVQAFLAETKATPQQLGEAVRGLAVNAKEKALFDPVARILAGEKGRPKSPVPGLSKAGQKQLSAAQTAEKQLGKATNLGTKERAFEAADRVDPKLAAPGITTSEQTAGDIRQGFADVDEILAEPYGGRRADAKSKATRTLPDELAGKLRYPPTVDAKGAIVDASERKGGAVDRALGQADSPVAEEMAAMQANGDEVLSGTMGRRSDEAAIQEALLGEQRTARGVIGRVDPQEQLGALQVEAAMRGADQNTIDMAAKLPRGQVTGELARMQPKGLVDEAGNPFSPGQSYDEAQTLEALLGRPLRTVSPTDGPGIMPPGPHAALSQPQEARIWKNGKGHRILTDVPQDPGFRTREPVRGGIPKALRDPAVFDDSPRWTPEAEAVQNLERMAVGPQGRRARQEFLIPGEQGRRDVRPDMQGEEGWVPGAFQETLGFEGQPSRVPFREGGMDPRISGDPTDLLSERLGRGDAPGQLRIGDDGSPVPDWPQSWGDMPRESRIGGVPRENYRQAEPGLTTGPPGASSPEPEGFTPQELRRNPDVRHPTFEDFTHPSTYLAYTEPVRQPTQMRTKGSPQDIDALLAMLTG